MAPWKFDELGTHTQPHFSIGRKAGSGSQRCHDYDSYADHHYYHEYSFLAIVCIIFIGSLQGLLRVVHYKVVAGSLSDAVRQVEARSAMGLGSSARSVHAAL